MASSLFTSEDADATIALGNRIARAAKPGAVWALVGGLGAGKTHFTKGVAQGLGIDAAVTSPTFTLIHEYTGGRLPLYHFDFYRLDTAEEALDLGLDEYLDGAGLTIIEWADKFPALLPPRAEWFHFELAAREDTPRIIRHVNPRP